MKSFVRNNIRRWLIMTRGKFSPPLTEGANRVKRRVIFSLPLRDVPFLRYVPSLCNLLLFLLILLAAPACKQPTAPDPKPEFSFTIEDASCTEAWLNVKTANFGSGFSFALNRNDSTIWRFAALPPDTIIVDEGLLPNKEYTYELLAISSKTAPISAGKKKVTTMDTTSHNFTWQTWEFGDIGSSVLYDVAIIDENNIWAVGEISIRDSSHNGYTTYNAVHWDGVKWELKRILFPTVCGSTDRTAFPSRSIIYLQNGIIWAGSSGDKIAVMKDNIQVNQFCLPTSLQMGINKMWGTSDKDVYAVGNSGNIAHYDGVSWKKIASGTDMDIYDIYGDKNEIILTAGKHFQTLDRKILSLNNQKVTELSSSNINPGSLYSLWFKSERKYYVVGQGIYSKLNVYNKWSWKKLHNGLTPYYIYGIAGTDYNNLFVCGSFGEVIHYNGYTWKTYRNNPGFNNYEYWDVAMKNSKAVLVGYNGIEALIVMGN